MERRGFLKAAAAIVAKPWVMRAAGDSLDLRGSEILLPTAAGVRERKAAQVLQEEAEKRCGIRWQISDNQKSRSNVAISLATRRSTSGVPHGNPSAGRAINSLSSDGYSLTSGTSAGQNDDVNKFIWSALGWNSGTPVEEAVRDFTHFFAGGEVGEGYALCLMHLELNWRGALATNVGVDVTLERFQQMERSCSPAVLENWRFQQALYRAYFDAYVRTRLLAESAALERARGHLEEMLTIGWGAVPLHIGWPPASSPPNGLTLDLWLDAAQSTLAQTLTAPGSAKLNVSSLRARMAAGELVVGMTVTINNLEAAALAARLGFHFLWVEMEHSPVSLETLRQIVLATSGLPAAVLARVPVVALWSAKQVLDQGVGGVVFPFVSNSGLAATAADACRYPLAGRRGSGAGLAASTWPEWNYYDSADEHILTVCVVEEVGALQHLDAIAAMPGVDVIFIGTSDLSFSLGLRGRQDGAELNQAIEAIVSAAQRHGKFLGRPAGTPEEMLRYAQKGFRMFQTVTELGLMRTGAAQILRPLGISTTDVDRHLLY
jgi:2-keto-3-deoxy-L-rhamnonate aldolase RhmA